MQIIFFHWAISLAILFWVKNEAFVLQRCIHVCQCVCVCVLLLTEALSMCFCKSFQFFCVLLVFWFRTNICFLHFFVWVRVASLSLKLKKCLTFNVLCIYVTLSTCLLLVCVYLSYLHPSKCYLLQEVAVKILMEQDLFAERFNEFLREVRSKVFSQIKTAVVL